jgi:hypothetical protein
MKKILRKFACEILIIPRKKLQKLKREKSNEKL